MPTPRSEPLILVRARRLAGGAASGNAIGDLMRGSADGEVAAKRGLPLATVEGIRSGYDLIALGPRYCDGTSCHFSGAAEVRSRHPHLDAASAVRCLGHCYEPPAFQVQGRVYAGAEGWEAGEIPRRSLAESPVVLRHLVAGAAPADFSEYDLPPGAEILAALEQSHLRGRGGASFPTAAKWRTARDTAAERRYVVANGDEGDPGSFVDRLLMEEDPHAILAGMAACAKVIGATHGIVYVRGEYPRAQASIRAAIEAARAADRLGRGFDIEVISGAGSYVCGEETALLRSIAGLRGEAQPKPPYPAEAGLHGFPTVVQNVETLAIVPWAARQRRPSGTKAMSLSGAIRHPGVVEVPLGTPLRRVLTQAGGGPPADRGWRMALIGGPLGRVVPERDFDVPLSYEGLPGLGHAGIVVLDEGVSPRALAEHLFEFARLESCSACAPCRIGAARLAGIRDASSMRRLLETLEMGSLCGFGQSVPRPIRDLLEHFGDQVFA